MPKYKPKIGDVSMYGHECLRNVNCLCCKYYSDLDLKSGRYDERKCFCNKTKYVGKIKRGYYCKHFESRMMKENE